MSPSQFWQPTAQFLQFQKIFLIGVQELFDAFLNAGYLLAQSLLSAFRRVGILDLSNPALDLCTNQIRIFKQLDHLFPNNLVQIILTNRPVMTKGPIEMAIGIRTQATIVVDFSPGYARRTPVKGIPAFTANQHTLQKSRFDGAPGGKSFVLLQPLLSKGKGLLSHNRRNGYLNPLLSGPLTVAARAWRKTTSST